MGRSPSHICTFESGGSRANLVEFIIPLHRRRSAAFCCPAGPLPYGTAGPDALWCECRLLLGHIDDRLVVYVTSEAHEGNASGTKTLYFASLLGLVRSIGHRRRVRSVLAYRKLSALRCSPYPICVHFSSPEVVGDSKSPLCGRTAVEMAALRAGRGVFEPAGDEERC